MLTIKFESKELAELRKENLELKEKMWRYGSIGAQLREATMRAQLAEERLMALRSAKPKSLEMYEVNRGGHR